jgi:hypothetical protein
LLSAAALLSEADRGGPAKLRHRSRWAFNAIERIIPPFNPRTTGCFFKKSAISTFKPCAMVQFVISLTDKDEFFE